VTVANRPQPIDDVADLADPEKNAIPELGIIGVDVSQQSRTLLPGLRKDFGVLVAARTKTSSGTQIPLVAGDVIHSVNAIPIRSADGLRVILSQKGTRQFVLQVERDGQLRYISGELY
jgi:S1-C subfamily serine protease